MSEKALTVFIACGAAASLRPLYTFIASDHAQGVMRE